VTSTLMGHTQCVSAVTWPGPDVLYSASWDHSIRQWDVPSGKETWTMVSHVVYFSYIKFNAKFPCNL
jgi:WD40 repeat protein